MLRLFLIRHAAGLKKTAAGYSLFRKGLLQSDAESPFLPREAYLHTSRGKTAIEKAHKMGKSERFSP